MKVYYNSACPVCKAGIDAQRNSPRERWKAWLFGFPVIKQWCRLAYDLFARALYRWNRSKHHW